jgi:TolA-binding protein
MSLYKDSQYREAALYRLADIAYRRHDAPLAVRRLDELAGLFPQGKYEGSAERMRGDVFFDQKDYEKALFAYEQSIADLREGSERQAVWYSLGLAELMLDRKTKAAEAFSKAATGQAGDLGERAMYQRALLLVGLSRNDEAIQALYDMLGAYPESARSEEALKLLGSLLDSRLDFQKSLPLWDSLLKRYPRSASLAEYVYRRGTARMNLGDLAALDDFQRVIREFPTSEFRNESEYSIGYIYSRRGEYARAIPYFRGVSLRAAGAELGERSSLAMGVCLFNMGSFDDAIASLEYLRARATAAGTQAVIALYEGRALYRLERLAEAAERLAAASQSLEALDQPSLHAGQAADAAYWLGWSLFRIGKLADARDAFLSLSRKHPSDPRSLESIYRAGVCETLRGDDAAAVTLFSAAAGATETIVGAAGGGPSEDHWREQALYEKGWALSRMGSGQASVETFHELAARFPNGRLAPEAFFKAATNAFDTGSYAEARSGFQAVIRDFPGSGLVKQALYWKAECARQSGDAQEALDELWTCLTSDPGQSVLSAALKGFEEALESLSNISLAQDFAQKAKDEKGLDVVVVASLELDYARMLLAQDASETLAVLDDVRHRSPPEPLAGEASLLTGQAFAALSQWQRAIDILAPLSDSRADEVGARATRERARALEASGNLADAITQYLRIAYLFSAYADLGAESMYNAARLALRMGDRENAARIQEGLRTRFPGSLWVSRLQDLKGPRDANEPQSH